MGELTQNFGQSNLIVYRERVEATEVLEENIGCLLSEIPWNQPINVYGVTPSRYEYINTCEVYQLKLVLGCLQAHWWEGFAVELVNQPGRMIPVTEVLLFREELQQLRLTQLDKTKISYRQAVASLKPLPKDRAFAW